MKRYISETSSGITTVFDNVWEAIAIGRKYSENGKNDKDWMVNYQRSDKKSENLFFEQCVDAIHLGMPELKEQVNDIVEEIKEVVEIIHPSLMMGPAGFERTDEGHIASADLIAAGEELCCFKPAVSEEVIKPEKSGMGAYRIIINTDVGFCGSPTDECALVAALVQVLGNHKPVEVWIQQGWLGGMSQPLTKAIMDYWDCRPFIRELLTPYLNKPCQHTPVSGVSLFKLDFTGGFDPSMLCFWIAHYGKDSPFSYIVNRGAGRLFSGTSHIAEIPCDLMLRGDLMAMVGMSWHAYKKALHTERVDMLSNWVVHTAKKIVFEEGPIPVD